MDKLKAPRQVHIEEDASGIVDKYSYDSSTNQIIGLVLPLDSKTGMPIPFTFTPQSVDEMEDFIKKPKSTLVYFVLAQPIKENVPPFILQIYGIDNKFKSADVLQRWKLAINWPCKSFFYSLDQELHIFFFIPGMVSKLLHSLQMAIQGC